MAPTVTSSQRADGIVVVTFSNPPVNALSSTLQLKLSEKLRALTSDAATRAIVVTALSSLTPGFFSSGVDISEFIHFSSGHNPFSPAMQWCFDGAEDSPVPIVAAVDGVCFGGALELAMCFSARVASPRSSFALPELSLGIIPGSGGTQRLPRLVGFRRAADMMLSTKPIAARAALDAQLVDRVVHDGDDVVAAAVDLARDMLASKVTLQSAIERDDRIGTLRECEQTVQQLRASVVPKLSKRGQMPQFAAVLDVALFGKRHGGRAGLREEARVFADLVASPVSRAMVHFFFATRQTSKLVLAGDAQPRQPGKPPRKVGVIGGGLMGAGIAAAMLAAGIPVVVKELNHKFAAAAHKRVEKNLGAKGAARMPMLETTTEYAALADVDIVIEAALENPKLKMDIFRDLESHCRSDCILASNTSTINVDLIAMGCPKAHREGRVIGAHFFSPAHKMPLLEIVRTESTAAAVIKDVVALAKKIKKTPVVVGNCAGFAVNRMYFPQSMVAGFLTTELRLDVYRVDKVCEAFGLAMGPFRLVDLVGLDIGVAVGGVFEVAFADRAVGTNPVIAGMLAAGRKGQKSGRGFYAYDPKTRAATPDREGVAEFLQEARGMVDSEHMARVQRNFGEVSDDDIVNMLLLACVNEGCRIIEEGVARSSNDLDICSVMGMAFPAHKGGLMYWAQHEFGSASGAMEKLEKYFHASGGFPLFKPSFALARSAAAGKALGIRILPTRTVGGQDDIVVVSAYRTAVGRAGRGGFKDTLPDNLLIPVLQRILEETKVSSHEVGDILTGTVLQRGDTGVVQLRVAGLLAGLPQTVPVKTVNRLCSSGLQAIADGAASISAGHHEIVIAGGMESMSMASMQNKELQMNPLVTERREALGCYMSMGQTSENVAEKFGISRERQDKLAVTSHSRASVAKLAGRQCSEIVPIETKVKIIDKQTKKVLGEKEVVVNADEGVRMGVTMQRLSKLPAVFKKGGSTTPGNSSQLSDGAAFVMLMKRSTAATRGLSPLATLRSFAVVGVEPAVMGIGPAEAIPVALSRAGITTEDVDLFELNEAFGSQADYCIEKLNLNRDIVNVMGGAIAIGHPLGMTGARLTVSIIHELHRRGGRFGVVSMCIGAGMGAAAVYEIQKDAVHSRM